MSSAVAAADSMKVAVVQMVSGADLEANLAAAWELVQQAVTEGGARLLVLPENFALFDTRQMLALGQRERHAATLQQRLAGWADELGVWLVAGSVPVARAENEVKVFARSWLFAPDGRLVSHYDKIHLFDVDVGDAQGRYCESDTFLPGERLVVSELEGGHRLGQSICYDLRFAELYRGLADRGATCLSVPSAFTHTTGEAHWEVLLRARAIEYQCYVLAANQGGAHSATRRTWGHSMIIDPWGQIVARCESGPGYAVADMALNQVTAMRARMPVAEHRRLR